MTITLEEGQHGSTTFHLCITLEAKPKITSGEITTAVEALLLILGAMTPDGIADWLRARGYTGTPADGSRCPIAMAIKGETGQKLMIGRTRISAKGKTVKFAESISHFIVQFDTSRYRDLVDVPNPYHHPELIPA